MKDYIPSVKAVGQAIVMLTITAMVLRLVKPYVPEKVRGYLPTV
jgi:hypothetical protein